MKVTYKAAAKINLMLDILARLENGYHSLFMIMQSVSLFDEVTVERKEKGGIIISSSEKRIPCDETNIAYKAASKFFDKTGIDDRNISIYLDKSNSSGKSILSKFYIIIVIIFIIFIIFKI